MSHLKSLAAPKSWVFLRKAQKYITKPHPCGHDKNHAQPLGLLIKQLRHAHTTREARKLLGSKSVLVDGKVVRDHKRSVGFMDVIQFNPAKQSIRLLLDTKGRLTHVPVPDKETNIKIGRITNKTPVKGGKIQLTLNDGYNLLIEKDAYKNGDSLVISTPKISIQEHLPLQEGCTTYLTGGSHVGLIAKITKIYGNMIILKGEGKEIRTHNRHVFVIGKTKSVITLS